MKTVRYTIPSEYHQYLGIPYDEEVVPFPNFGTVLIQHRRYLPDKRSFSWFQKESYTFFQWSSCVRALSRQLIESGLNGSTPVLVDREPKPESILLFHALLDAGIPAVIISKEEHLVDFPDDLFPVAIEGYMAVKFPVKKISGIQFSNLILSNIPHIDDPLEIPCVRLDYPAVYARVNNVWAEYSQYNILSASQSVGKELSLFREGRVSFSKTINDLSDWLLAVITPFYYGSEVRFDEPFHVANTEKILKEKECQVVVADIDPNQIVDRGNIRDDTLRDIAFLYVAKDDTLSRRNLPFPWRELWNDDRCSGNGYFFQGKEGRMCKAMDYQIEKISESNKEIGHLILSGHSLAQALFLPEKTAPVSFLKRYFLTSLYVRKTSNMPPDFILLDDQ
ncbi:MAG TPA: hypothetical protein ENO01_02490 [Candidatus Marinimicrobia bacterium]|nr:hypothetical protein [Candidatus Neomarinimicrobiota bacterium]